MLARKVFKQLVLFVVIPVCYSFATYEKFSPVAKSCAKRGLSCVVYNFSPWAVKILPLGEPLSRWESGPVAVPDRALFSGNDDPWLVASPSVLPDEFKPFCLPIKKLHGFKFHVITMRTTKEFKFLNDGIDDFSVFVLQQKIIQDKETLEESYYLDIIGFENEESICWGPTGVLYANVARFKAKVSHFSCLEPICRLFIGKKAGKRKSQARSIRFPSQSGSDILNDLPMASPPFIAPEEDCAKIPSSIVAVPPLKLSKIETEPEEDEGYLYRIGCWEAASE